MSDELVVRHCAPTLAGIKTGNLFSCSYRSRRKLVEELCRLNQRLVPRGLRALPLRMEGGRALIYLYRPHALERDLADSRARAILEGMGYRSGQCAQCVARLIQRLREEGDFPHEIGLFLSYPPEDVLGFMENSACGYKCVGCWKVYGDEAAARSAFARYEACTRAYCRKWEQGASIEGLTVAG